MTMTSQQNGDINSEQQFVLQCNMSSCKQKLSNPSEKAWITVCKHIFCNFCGLDHLSQSLPLKCPICSHQLTSVFDILTAQLNPPTHFQSMVLMGMNPEDCLLAAQSGIQFWETQVSKQLCDQKHKADNVQQELREMHRNYDEKITTLSSENAALQEECRQVKEQLKMMMSNPTMYGTSKPIASTEPSTSDNNNRLYNTADENAKPIDTTVISTVRKQAYPPPSIPLPHLRSSDNGSGKSKNRQFLEKYQ